MFGLERIEPDRFTPDSIISSEKEYLERKRGDRPAAKENAKIATEYLATEVRSIVGAQEASETPVPTALEISKELNLGDSKTGGLDSPLEP